ncbi:archaeosortase A [Natronolimnohabitans innermongolicus]|uniref:Exosortase EpsH-like protein n=1 Tax=Natronolimnohabitans innermongolicus JCM 12255 TaxID=1227499 RepID=L9XGP5_9EURY|nr:archaeosortase A [Natronolimnohabitans innermongolicus]ELY60787.1 Exosortase EpsH-like protein [Natronolimnohabitans innermongolicus JCM 12255]
MPTVFSATDAASVGGLETTLTGASTLTPVSMPAVLGSVGATDLLAWVSIGAFLTALLLRWRGVAEPARYLGTGAWLSFGVFWATMAPYYYYDVQSPLQTILALIALPLCAYTGYLLWNGRDSLFLLTKAIALMGVIYLPAETIPVVRQWLIETTATQTHYGMELLGHSPGIEEGSNGYQSRFAFDSDETVTGRTTYIILACTGLGSMAIFGGLIAAVKAPLRRKVAAFAMAVGVIWFLNLLRNVFIGLASPWGWFQQDWLVSFMTTYMGAEADRVSYLVAHNYISQALSVVALVGITYLLIKILPEILKPLEEVLFVVTGTEYDLFDALGKSEVRADGGAEHDRRAEQ